MIQYKQELTQPFTINTQNRAVHLINCLHVFGNAGNVGTQPATIPDLMGNHDITMTYGASGGLVGDGAMQLQDNGAASTNTYGEFSNVDTNWQTNVGTDSRFYVIDFTYKANAQNYQYLYNGLGALVFYQTSTNKLYIRIENISQHRLDWEIDNPSDGRYKVAFQINKTTTSGRCFINGVDYGVGTPNGDPWTKKPIVYGWIGRFFSWPHYYGWDGHVNLFAAGFNVNGEELSDAELQALSLDSYSLLQNKEQEETEYGLTFNGVNQYLSLSEITLTDFDITVEFSTNTTTNKILLGDSHTTSYYFNILTDKISVWASGTEHSFTPPTFADGEFHTARYVLVGTTLEVFFDGVSLGTKTIVPYTGTLNLLIGNSNSFNAYFDGTMKRVSINEHYFDFNQTSAPSNKVYSLTSSLLATLNNFPVDSGHVVEYETTLGHELDAATNYITFPTIDVQAGDTITIKYIANANIIEGYFIDQPTSGVVGQRPYCYITGAGTLSFSASAFSGGTLDGVAIVNGTTVPPNDNREHTIVLTVSAAGQVGIIGARFSLGNKSNNTLVSYEFGGSISHKFDFTQPITGGVVVDQLGNKDATVNGNPLEVRYDLSTPSTIVGYEFNGDNYGDAPVWTPTTTNWRFKTKFRIEKLDGLNQVVISNGTHNNGVYVNYNNTQLNAYVAGSYKQILHDGVGSEYEIEYVSTSGTVEIFINGVSQGTFVKTLSPTLGLNICRRIETSNANAKVTMLGQTIFTDVDDNTNSRSYDFTLGDDDEIIDTENGQHGSIVNAKTSGFMPTVTTDVVTIGTNQDYTTLSAAASVEKNSTDHKEFLVFGTVAIGGDITGAVDSEAEYQGGLTIRGNEPYDGRLSTDMTGVSTLTTSSTTERIQWGCKGNKFKLKDIALKALAADIGSGLAFNAFRDGLSVDIENVALVGGGGTSSTAYGLKPISASGTQSVFNIRQLMVTNFSASGIWADVAQVTVNLNDAVVYGNNTSGNTYRGGVDCGGNDSLTAVNVLAFDNGHKDFYRISAGSTYLFSKDATATGDGSQTGVVVALSGDKLDQTTQDTYFKGKGWNGSDALSWAYAIGAVELTITVATLDSTITVYQPAVTTDTPLTISPITLESASVSYAPLVTKDKLITTDTLDTTAIAYDPTVLKDKVITLDSLDNINITYAPTITSAQTVVVDTLNNVSVAYEPVVLRDKKIDLGFHTNTSTTYEPSVVSSKFMTLNSLDNTSVIYGFNILQDKLIELDTMDNQGYVFEPEVIGGYRPIPVVTLYKAEGYGLHIRSAEHMNAVIQELAKRIEKLEGH